MTRTIYWKDSCPEFDTIQNYSSFRLEDGTLPFLDIVSLRHGFDALERLGGKDHELFNSWIFMFKGGNIIFNEIRLNGDRSLYPM